MKEGLITVIIQEGTRFFSQYLRSRPPKRPASMDEPLRSEEEPLELIKEPPEFTEIETEAQPENKSTSIEKGCIPCALGHMGTCTGFLDEGMRFARKDGLDSEMVIDRINQCLIELNTMERGDLTSEMIVNLPKWEKDLAIQALSNSRDIRHGLEGIETIDQLEEVTAKTKTAQLQISRDWFKHKLQKEGSNV